jgi:hypothetical protein
MLKTDVDFYLNKIYKASFKVCFTGLTGRAGFYVFIKSKCTWF